jgi:3-deoxy-manno-octulosonate cytidylyltransferase (CMP-KDO synthetase)
VAEVATRAEYSRYDTVLSIQSDEPFFSADAARGALARVRLGDPIGTASAPLTACGLTDPNRVKVVVNGAGHALRFARVTPASAAWGCDVRVMHHIGIYAFRPFVLKQWMKWDPPAEEISEGLEQLRALHHGVTIGVATVADAAPVAVDTEHDLQLAEAYLESQGERVGR